MCGSCRENPNTRTTINLYAQAVSDQSHTADRENGRLSIYFDRCKRHASAEMRSNCSNKFRDTVSARNRNPRLAHQPFVVRVRDNILSQERFQSTHFSPRGGTDEGVQKSAAARPNWRKCTGHRRYVCGHGRRVAGRWLPPGAGCPRSGPVADTDLEAFANEENAG